METVEGRFNALKSAGEVGFLLDRPPDARWLLVLGHGAGAGMRHPFMETVSRKLADRKIATFRYQFPYMEQGVKRPDPAPILLATVRAAVYTAAEMAPGLVLLAGGKSMGGRMTSRAASEGGLSKALGLVFLGFPLHPAGMPSSERGEHLVRVTAPMLFLQGTRDALADLALIDPLCRSLGDRATLHIVEGADHSFHVLKRSGRTNDEVLEELCGTIEAWAARL